MNKQDSGFPEVSIIIPCYNEEKFIGTTLSNIVSQDYPHEHLEVLVMDGMSNDGSRRVIKSYEEEYGFIHLEDNPRRFVPFALNDGISKARGAVIMIMGSHAVYPADYVSVLVQALYDLNADNVGGLCDAQPSASTLNARSVAKVVSSPFGVGNAYFRIGTKKRMKVDTVTFGCYRREVFDRIGMFDEELIRNQDDEFNNRLTRNGGSIYLIPEIKIDYFPRARIRSQLRMYYQYGLFKPLVSKKNGRPATVRQLVPPGFVLFLLGGIPLSFLSQLFSWFFLGVVGLYVLLDLFFSFRISIKSKSPGMLVILPWLFFLLHFSYGTGYLAGLVIFVLLKRKKPQIPSTR